MTLAKGGRYSRHVKSIRIGLLILANDHVGARQRAGLLLYEMSPSARPDRQARHSKREDLYNPARYMSLGVP
jgi:hypothetical protein